MFIVHLTGTLLSATMSFEFVQFIETMSLCKLINFATNETGQKFFGKSVVNNLSY
jgi:hypothetical protein